MSRVGLSGAIVLGVAALVSVQAQGEEAPGADKSAQIRALEAGAKLLQGNAPVRGFDIYLIGFHPMKANPELQMEAHHYCRQTNQDFAQCVLFNDNTQDAKLNGVEYIISEALFESLPEGEKHYWHPHNGEILTGQLIAPGIPEVAEKALMKSKMNSYGKTWHVWNTGHEGHSPDGMPLGDPQLGWSFNRDGEALPGLVEKRDQRLDIDTAALRRSRTNLEVLARPQAGVDALEDKFERQTKAIPRVVNKYASGSQ